MSSTRRRTLTAALAVLGALISGAAIAWACTPQANIGIQGPTSGPPGTTVTVSGADFAPGGPVSITWNGSQVLASATGPEFSVPVTIPNSPADTHTIVAIGKELNGTTEAGRARATFTITGVAPDPGTGPATSGGDGRGPGSSAGNASGGDTASSGRSGATANGGERVTARSPAGRNGATPSGEAPLATADSVFADSTVASQGRGDAAIGARRATAEASPSARSAAANLWSGFAKGSTPSLGNVADDVESGSVPGVTLTLLALGLTAVLGGVAVTATRRRRAGARSAGPSD